MADNPRKRPDPRPMRLAYAAGAVAALSGILAGLVRAGGGTGPAPASSVQLAAQDRPVRPRSVEVHHVIRYVHLKPGESAPPGARVITPDAPAPRVIVTRVSAPAPAPPPRRTVVTRQSGRP